MTDYTKPTNFMVYVNDTKVSEDVRQDIKAITVHDDLTAASMFTLELYNWDDDELKFTWSDDTTFAPGNEIQVWLGYLDNVVKILVGEVTSMEPNFGKRAPTLIVRGYDHRHRLLRGPQLPCPAA